MVTKVSNFLVKEMPPLAVLPVMLMVAKTIQTIVNGIFASRQEAHRTFLAIAASIVIVPILRPFTYYTVAVLVVVNTVMLVIKTVFNKKTSPPPLLPNGLKSVSQEPLKRRSSLSYPEPIKKLQQQIQPGKLISFKAAEGWDLDFFSWAVTRKPSLVGYRVYYFSGDVDENSIKTLEEYIKNNPKSIIITTKNFLQSFVLPEKSYVIEFLPSEKNRDSSIALSPLSEEHWIQSGYYLSHFKHTKFEGDSIKIICKFIWKSKSQSVYKDWIHPFLPLDQSAQIIGIFTLPAMPDRLFVYSKDQTYDLQHLLNTTANIRKYCKIEVYYYPAYDPVQPSYLSQIPKSNVCEGRGEQAEQIFKSIRGKEGAPHAMVGGVNHAELENILSMPVIQTSKVFNFGINWLVNNQDMYVDPFMVKDFVFLLHYLWRHPNTILYISALDRLFLLPTVMGSLLQYLPPETVIVGQTALQSNLSAANIDQNTEQLQKFEHIHTFKQVRLMPLTQAQCLAEITAWAQTKYKLEKYALEIAVTSSFLLHKENGTEFPFIQDMIERAANENGEILIQGVWKAFIPMYHCHVGQLGESKKAIPLICIAITLSKKYNLMFPAKEINPAEPPEFLIDLNEAVKTQNCGVPIQTRLDDLEDALTGQYHNALIIGLSGVGKTTLVQLAAWMSVNNKFKSTHPLYGKTIYALNLTALQSGITYVGTLETKINELFNFLMQSKNAVLFIDEIHLIIGAGAYRGNEMGTVSQHMKTYLEAAGIMVIGATTKEEYYKWVTQDGAFTRRFNTMDLGEPTDKEVLGIFKHYVASESFKKINNSIEFNDENFVALLNEIKQQIKNKSLNNISIIDTGKKMLEQLAKANKRTKETTVTHRAFS